MYRSILFSLLILFATMSFAGRGPTHKSLRAYAMGNAFVAVAEDKEAVYYNPAGLNLINKLGNFETNPEMGYYARKLLDMRLNVGVSLPLSQAQEAYSIGTDIQKVYKSIDMDKMDNRALLDTVEAHIDILDRMLFFDKLPINISSKFDAELALPHFGGAIWVDGGVAPYIESGIITPGAGIDTVYIDAVIQGAVGFGIGENLSLGLGYKMAKREYISDLTVSLLEWEDARDTLMAETDRIIRDASKISTIGHALEFGAMYQIHREVRLGASLRNLFVKKLGKENITPNLTTGIAYSPRFLQRNTGLARKVNLAFDYEDVFNNERNYKFMSHINFGGEFEQVILAVPNWPALRFLKVRGSLGFKGGYPTAGFALEALRLAEIEFATWAEEAGYYTGAEENRYWVFQVSIGI
ncbi:MAG: hypothetical protein GX801_02095 [Fibrobacter sp.]|nr:hypothetical protein [Fibrobacter sp.]